MIEARQTRCGQYERYGAYFRVWEVTTNLSEEDTVKWCFDNLHNSRVLPSETEWRGKIIYKGEKWGDADYYFAGYYNIDKTENGFTFAIGLPYDG